jgi:sec-independent protein translocase protein TatA
MNTLALIPGMSGLPEILVIVFVVLLLFGSKKIPELFRSLGKSLNEFKRGQQESDLEKKPDAPEEAAPADPKDPTEPQK